MTFLKREIFGLFAVFLAISPELVKSDDYRLDKSVTPSHYDVELTVLSNFGETASFTGQSSVIFTSSNEVPFFQVHVQGLTFDYLIVYNSADENQTNILSSYVEDTTVQKLNITLSSSLITGQTYVLAANFTGILYDDMLGFYRSYYTDESGTIRWLATTQFQPTYARRAFPCFDEPSFKSTFNISIIHPGDLHAVCNTPLSSTEEYDTTNGLVKSVFQKTPIMSTYLIAFVVSNFSSMQNDSINYGVYAASHVIDTAQYAFEYGPKFLTAMADFIDYPYLSTGIGKLDQIAIPDFDAGAMENWGLITYREGRLLYDENESAYNSRKVIGAVIMHETAHMWFGDLVTCDWWSYTWLNEGFARYFQYFGTAWVETEMELDKLFVVEQLQTAFASDSSTSSASLNSDCSTPTQISNKFSTISYNKGACVIRMMKYVLGEENWRQGLIDYIKARQFSTGIPSQLYSAWSGYATSASLPQNISTIMSSWADVGGFPVLTVTMSGNDAVISQKQFLLSTSQSSTREWYVPVTYTTSHEYNFDNMTPGYWLTPVENLTITNILHGGSGWILLNLQESGYYRVNYDEELWSQLKSGLGKDNFDGIPELNRAQIVDDVLNLARARTLSYTSAMDIISFLSKDTSYYPWYSAFTAFSYLKRRYQTHSTLATYFTTHVLDLMDTVYNSVSFDRDSSESYIDVQKKALVLQWACNLGHSECIEKSISLFSELRTSGTSVNPDIRGTVYCTALRNSNDAEDWYFLWNKLTQEELATELSIIIGALGCTKNETLLNEYMTLSLNVSNGIRRQDFTSVFSSVYGSNAEGIDIALNFVTTNYKTIIEYFDGSTSTLLTLLSNIATRMTSENEISKLETWLSDNSEDLSSISSSITNYITSAKANLQWAEECTTELNSFYVSYLNSASDIITPAFLSMSILSIHVIFMYL